MSLQQGQCESGYCETHLQLGEAGHGIHGEPFGWPLPEGSVLRKDETEGSPLATVLSCDSAETAWLLGLEEQSVLTVVCPIGPEGSGSVAVGIRAGFEHLKHRFEVFGKQGGSLKRIWEREDPVAPQFARLLVNRGANAFAHVVAKDTPGEQVDDFELAGFQINAAQSEVASTKDVGWIEVVTVGSFKTAKSAAEARSRSPHCLSQTFLLPFSRLGKGKSGFGLVTFTAGAAASDRVRSFLQDCVQKDVQVSVKPWKRN
jgi:hypothetical protein